jgi:hypothetical protein
MPNEIRKEVAQLSEPYTKGFKYGTSFGSGESLCFQLLSGIYRAYTKEWCGFKSE